MKTKYELFMQFIRESLLGNLLEGCLLKATTKATVFTLRG